MIIDSGFGKPSQEDGLGATQYFSANDENTVNRGP